MSARAVRLAASGRGASRRVQIVVIFLVLLASTAAATIGLALLAVDSSGPFQRSFAAQHGADVVAGINPARVTAAQLAATRHLPQVTQAAGPFPETSARLNQAGQGQLATLTVAGRSSSAGPVDDLTLTEGRWVQRPGEIVIAGDLGQGPNREVYIPIGSRVTDVTAPGKPVLTVVGVANSITDTAGAWVVPAEISALRPAGAPPAEEMLYRFAQAGSAAQIRAGAAAVRAALPRGALAGPPASWLNVESEANGSSSVIAPFVIAFAIMGLAMSVLIVTNVVSGAVVAGYRRIGVLKSIGLTPAQVVTAYVTRIGWPALAGCVLGVAAGNVLASPVLRHSARLYGVGHQSVPIWVDVATPLGMVALTGLAALLPALRASRLSAVQAIAVGQAPRQDHGFAAQRLLGRMRLPRPVTLGLAAPFARPARTAITLAAITFGATAVIFAVGLDVSLAHAKDATSQSAGPGQVQVFASGPSLTAGQDREAVAAIRAQAGTAHYVAEAMPTVWVSGLTKQVDAEALDGNAAWTDYTMIQGHWYSGTGQADVNTVFLNQTGLSVGDTTPVSLGGRPVLVRIVGEVFDPDRQPVFLTSWQTLGGASAGLTVAQYDIALRPGVSAGAYANSLGRALGSSFGAEPVSSGNFFAIATSLIGILTLMIVVVAGLGVLNTVLLGTRERVHDLGVFKALGMTPRQAIGMVVCWVAGPAVAAAIIAVPTGILLHAGTVHAMANAAGTALPASIVHMVGPADLIALALSGLVIAAAGALLPGSWAARASTATALRAE